MVLRSGTDYIKPEPEEISPGCGPSSSLLISLSTVALPLLPPPSQSFPLCDCGNPAVEEQNAGYGNPENMYRMMYVCSRLGGKKCEYLKYKDEDERRVKQEPESLPADGRKTPERQITDSLLTPPTSPPERPPPPTGTYHCGCHKLAKQYFCEKGRPENVGKYYYTCPDEYCDTGNGLKVKEMHKKESTHENGNENSATRDMGR